MSAYRPRSLPPVKRSSVSDTCNTPCKPLPRSCHKQSHPDYAVAKRWLRQFKVTFNEFWSGRVIHFRGGQECGVVEPAPCKEPLWLASLEGLIACPGINHPSLSLQPPVWVMWGVKFILKTMEYLSSYPFHNHRSCSFPYCYMQSAHPWTFRSSLGRSH